MNVDSTVYMNVQKIIRVSRIETFSYIVAGSIKNCAHSTIYSASLSALCQGGGGFDYVDLKKVMICPPP
jgi:hypothetical protein